VEAVGLVKTLRQELDQRMESIHQSFQSRIGELYAETWRLREAVDSRLGLLERQLEEHATRLDACLLEVQAAAGQVRDSCRGLAETFDAQFDSAERSIQALRDAQERRLRQVEESHRSVLAALRRDHQRELDSVRGERCRVDDRLRLLAEEALLSVAEPDARFGSPRGASILRAQWKTLSRALQGSRARELEDTLRSFAARLEELSRESGTSAAERESAPWAKELVPEWLSPTAAVTAHGPPNGSWNGSSNGNGNGNGNGHAKGAHRAVNGSALD
jgi:hypothetical protein